MTDMEPTDSNAPEAERRDRTSFYTHAAEYWSSVPATIDGMLGGFGIISQTDIQGSVSFLKQLFKVG
jgi:protein N-terminal methyltransferase